MRKQQQTTTGFKIDCFSNFLIFPGNFKMRVDGHHRIASHDDEQV
jgi:hypothetical protein